ncbi:MAG: DUF4838 domain-containing protein [Lentisphaeria bacterium]|nr:DUF4838 domain-containing protein [Lentisphaeria bacterium]
MKNILLTVLAVLVCAAEAAERIIVKNGKSDYVIVYNTSTGVPLRAAQDLQHYIHKAVGVKLPLVKNAQRKNRPAFVVGFDKVTAPEAFIVKTAGRDIHISGNDTQGNVENAHWASGARTGTWYGVCDFLEKQLGIRWFMPGELGEYVPKRKEWSVPDLDYKDKPAMDKRRMSYVAVGVTPQNIREGFLFLRRNRHGNADSWAASHSWLHHLKGKDYFDKHPEWFAQVGGRRLGLDPLGHGLHLCTTNKEALDQLAKNLIAYRKQFKSPIMLSLSPNDGSVLCECSNCAALDDGLRPDGSRIATTLMMTYANAVAQRVKKELPNQKFGLYAYSYYAEGVSKVKVDPSITIEEVLNDVGVSYYRKDVREKHLANLKAWRKVLKKLYFYTFPEGMGNLEMPCCQFYNIWNLFENLYKADVTGFSMNMPTSFGASALNNYFYLKMAWRMPENKEKFYNDTLRDCYGAAAAPVMKAYFADIEKRLYKMAHGKLEENRGMGYISRWDGIFKKVYPGLAEKWLPQLRAAARKTADRGQKARLDVAILNLEYCQDTINLYKLATAATARKGDPKMAAAADKLAVQRLLKIKKLSQLPSNTLPQRVEGDEKDARVPFDRKVFAYLMASKARKSAALAYKKDHPQLDGKVDDNFWKGLPVCRIEHRMEDSEKFTCGADVKLAFTKDFLYIAVRCEEPLMSKVKDSARGPKAKVWDENSIDIFLAPRGEKGHFQLVFNAIANYRFFKYTGKKSQELAGQAEVKTFRGKDFWSAEVKIPLSVLSARKELRGEIWGMNFCRTRRTVLPNEYSCWSPTFGPFGNPERFGRGVFR